MTWNQNNNQGWGAAPAAPMGGAQPSPWDNFGSIEAAPARNGYIPAGFAGELEVLELKVVSSAKNNNRPIFVASFRAIAVPSVEPVVCWDWVAKADERPYLINIKALVCALNPNGDPRSFGREVMEALTGPEQPARGLRVRFRSEAIETKRGSSFTKIHWFPAAL
ncbi:MAG: hypothetical protein FJ138_00480 [Deltaproteobacteria bacterium]|nr:hypothetical protein [Deltaproteobacteria bacterium]